jgi:anti-sigma factor RsiW
MLDGDLPDRERRELEEHLEGCARCRAELALREEIRAALAEPPAPALSARFTEGVMARLPSAPARRSARIRTGLFRGAAAVAVAALSFAPILSGGGGGSGLAPAGNAAGSLLTAVAAPLRWMIDGWSGIIGSAMPPAPVPAPALILVGAAAVLGVRLCAAYLRE